MQELGGGGDKTGQEARNEIGDAGIEEEGDQNEVIRKGEERRHRGKERGDKTRKGSAESEGMGGGGAGKEREKNEKEDKEGNTR